MSSEFSLSIEIKEFEFSREAFALISKNHWVKNQWPLIYFLHNKVEKVAYVGESVNALNRINDHLENPQRSVFKKISIIVSDKFNKSATLTIESQLIQHISAEGSFLLQNGNNGLSYHNFYQREEYDKLFKEIWSQLLKNKIVRKHIEEIQESNFFKYSPYKSLNQDQLKSVLGIIETLNTQKLRHIFVSGNAGTGKTILATYLVKLLTSDIEELNTEGIDEDGYKELELMTAFKEIHGKPVIGLVVSMNSLRNTLQEVFDQIPGLDKSMVIGPGDTFRKNYDILIIDEAHRLRQRKNLSWMGVFTQNNKKLGLDNDGTELDWVLAKSKYQIFFYDADQSIKPSDVPEKRFVDVMQGSLSTKLELKSQMRVKGGADYITFVHDLLHCKLQAGKIKYKPVNYDLQFFDSFKELYSELGKKEKRYHQCRLIAGYAWPWNTKNKKSDHDIEIEEIRFCWNRTDKDWINSPTSFEEVGCIHTTQGRDLNYAGVIFGKDIIYNPLLKRIEIIAENYYDRNGKAGIADLEDLRVFIINIYKTLMYRGISGTYIYACDVNLRRYLKEMVCEANKNDSLTILPIEKVRPYVNSVPVYNIQVAAGNFSEPQQAFGSQWVELPKPYKPSPDYFVCQVTGESMNKKIPNGSWCLFRKDGGGSREGKIVLVKHFDIQDADFGAGCTIKSYYSNKVIDEDTWQHVSIVLKPLSNDPSYEDIILTPESAGELRVVGIFVAVL
jgi:DUF2075 family protein/DNA replication protein DnaC/phage repressor protein C with HTH and peptisase S24 domain